MKHEFCYLRRKNNPYDYEIIDFKEIDPINYMTISNRGIT